MASLRQKDVLISFFLPTIGGQDSEQRHFSLIVRQEGQDYLRQAIMYEYNNKSSNKTRVKVKEMDLAWKSKNGLFSVTLAPAIPICLRSQNRIYKEGLFVPFQCPQHMWREGKETPRVMP